MFTRHDIPILWKDTYPALGPVSRFLSSTATLSILAAAGCAAFGALLIANISLDDPPSGQQLVEYKPGPVVGGVPCERQAWPFIDRRCLDAAAAANTQTRQVRVVAGNAAAPSTIVTGLPVIEPKPPQPQTLANVEPAVAHSGPPARPPMPEGEPAPQQVVLSTPAPAAPEPAPAPKPQARQQIAAEPSALTWRQPQQSAEATPPQPSTGVVPDQPRAAPQAFRRSRASSDEPPKETPEMAAMAQAPDAPTPDATPEITASTGKQTAKTEKPSKQAKSERRNGGVPPEVIAAIESLTSRGAAESARLRNGAAEAARAEAPTRTEAPTRKARTRQGVPQEVIEAVEAAAAERASRRRGGVERVIVDDGGTGGEVVTVGSPGRSGQRIFIVPSDGGF